MILLLIYSLLLLFLMFSPTCYCVWNFISKIVLIRLKLISSILQLLLLFSLTIPPPAEGVFICLCVRRWVFTGRERASRGAGVQRVRSRPRESVFVRKVPGGFVFGPWCVTSLPFTPGPFCPRPAHPDRPSGGKGFRGDWIKSSRRKNCFWGALMCGNRTRGRAQIPSPGNHGPICRENIIKVGEN